MFGADLKRGESRLVAESSCRYLIDTDAGANVGPIRLSWLRAGEERPEGARMIAAAIAVSAGLVRCQAGQHQ